MVVGDAGMEMSESQLWALPVHLSWGVASPVVLPSSNPSGGMCPMSVLALPPYPAAMDYLQPTAVTVFVAMPKKEEGFCGDGSQWSFNGVCHLPPPASTEPNTWWAGFLRKTQRKSSQTSPMPGSHTLNVAHTQQLGIP